MTVEVRPALTSPIKRRAVLVEDSVWPALAAWFDQRGVALVQVGSLSDEVPRYLTHSQGPAPKPTQGITARQRQVLLGIAAGKQNPQIAAELFIAVNTVKAHATRLYRKLGASDRSSAVWIACERGILGTKAGA